MIDEHDEKLDAELRKGRTCSEVYSCTEDFLYFLKLAIPFAN
jgi:hypothetical protein